jgi:hypothetical protein
MERLKAAMQKGVVHPYEILRVTENMPDTDESLELSEMAHDALTHPYYESARRDYLNRSQDRFNKAEPTIKSILQRAKDGFETRDVLALLQVRKDIAKFLDQWYEEENNDPWDRLFYHLSEDMFPADLREKLDELPKEIEKVVLAYD